MTIGERIDDCLDSLRIRWRRLAHAWHWLWMSNDKRIQYLDSQAKDTLLKPSFILWEAGSVLSQSAYFVENINRSYDASWAAKGETIGSTVNVRRPPRYRQPEDTKTP